MRRLLGLSLLVVVAVACKDDPEIEEPSDDSIWQENVNFQFDLKNQYNSLSTGEKLYFLGRSNLTTLAEEDGNRTYEHALLWLPYDLNHQMPLSDRVFVTANDRRVRFASTRNPVLNRSDFYLSMEEVDPTFTGFDFPGFDFGQAIGIDNQHRVIIPYFSSDESNLQTDYKLLLVQLEVIEDGIRDLIDTVSTQILPSAGPMIALHEFDDAFYITYNQGTFQIDRNGDVVLLSPTRPFYKMFAVGDALFGVEGEQVYTSTNGFNWVPAAINGDLRLLRYKQVGDFSIGYYNSQIFLFELSGEVLQITELDHAGLEGHEITSISIFEEDVFVTTFSGVFQKPLDHFDTPKAEEGASGS